MTVKSAHVYETEFGVRGVLAEEDSGRASA
jgi:hypothetical protein